MTSINHISDVSNQLEISQLVEFDSTLVELSDLDKKQRRVMYLRDARQQMDNGKSFSDSFGSFFKGMGLYLYAVCSHLHVLAYVFRCLVQEIETKDFGKSSIVKSFRLLAY
jgi:hypothetical protein